MKIRKENENKEKIKKENDVTCTHHREAVANGAEEIVPHHRQVIDAARERKRGQGRERGRAREEGFI